MAITRRQFVTRLGALAAVVGFSQAEVSKIAEAFAGNTTPFGARSTGGKPRVIWIHGAECTGCSTSLLGILESPDGNPLPTRHADGHDRCRTRSCQRHADRARHRRRRRPDRQRRSRCGPTALA